MTKKKILVVGGGYSKERIISLKTSKAVIKSIKKMYNVKFCEPDQNFFRFVKTLDQM
jgi:D-alanine-D-alanine ligase and related ATP-grasp enzymes